MNRIGNVVKHVPSGHRNYIHPANIGYNTTTDYHPAVCVGAMDDFIESEIIKKEKHLILISSVMYGHLQMKHCLLV